MTSYELDLEMRAESAVERARRRAPRAIEAQPLAHAPAPVERLEGATYVEQEKVLDFALMWIITVSLAFVSLALLGQVVGWWR